MAELKQAIVQTGGKQYRVAPGEVLRVEKLDGTVGGAIALDHVLLIGEGEKAKIGQPFISGAKVRATITAHGRGPKVVVYKFRRRKNYRVRRGHRQDFTEIRIDGIDG